MLSFGTRTIRLQDKMKSKMGRPKGKFLLEKNKILETALHLLDAHGSPGLSMRSLALSLKVTPMALYNHFPNRSSLLNSASDMVYREVTKAFIEYSGTTRGKLEFLLESYYKSLIKHPNLTIYIFEAHGAIPNETQNITQHLLELISSTRVPKSKQLTWLNILVDFTHGSSIATAKNRESNKSKKSVTVDTKSFSKELKVLLDCIL